MQYSKKAHPHADFVYAVDSTLCRLRELVPLMNSHTQGTSIQSPRTVRGAVSRDGTDHWDFADLRHSRIDRPAETSVLYSGVVDAIEWFYYGGAGQWREARGAVPGRSSTSR